MKFRTEIGIEKQPGFLNHNMSLITVGSCFSEHIGQRLTSSGFQVLNNPFGNLFNPLSVEKNIRHALSQELDNNLRVERQGKVYHYDFPSLFWGETEAGLMEAIEAVQSSFNARFKTADWLFLTLGTAWVYRLKTTQTIVANCHKMPQQIFEKELLDLDLLKDRFLAFFDDLRTQNPALKIVLTVSPVRHIKNGLHGNNLSKSVLLLLADFLQQKRHFVHYFPAYEMVIDDLRDYRFYNADMIHPNSQAVDYVYEQFQHTFFSTETAQLATLYTKLSQLEAHRYGADSTQVERDQMARHKQHLHAEIARLKGQL